MGECNCCGHFLLPLHLMQSTWSWRGYWKRHKDVHNGDIVIFCHIDYFHHHESHRSVSVVWDTNVWVRLAASGGCSCVSWHLCLVSHTMIVSLLHIADLDIEALRSMEYRTVYIGRTFRLLRSESNNVLSSPAP